MFGFSSPSPSAVLDRWSLDVNTSALGYLAMYGSGLRSQTVSTSDTRMSKPIFVNR